MEKIWYLRKQGKGSKPGKAGPPERIVHIATGKVYEQRSIRQRVNAGTLSINRARLILVSGRLLRTYPDGEDRLPCRAAASIHAWLDRKESGKT